MANRTVKKIKKGLESGDQTLVDSAVAHAAELAALRKQHHVEVSPFLTRVLYGHKGPEVEPIVAAPAETVVAPAVESVEPVAETATPVEKTDNHPF